MTRFVAFSSTLIVLITTCGCGGDSTSSSERVNTAGGAASQGGRGSGGAEGGGAGSGPTGTNPAKTEWLYTTDDEGVFPKNRVLDIQVTMSAEGWTKLITTAKQEVWSSADVTIDGQSVGTIGIRPKGEYSLDSCVGASGQLLCDKLSFKLKFNELDTAGRFYGLKKLALNQILDGGAVFMETLSYQIFNDFGIVAPRTSYATVTVNGESLGVYRVVEVVDGRFTKTHFAGGNGNLYKEAWPVETDEAYFANALETNEDTATNETFVSFAADMLAATDSELPQTLTKHMDLGKVLDYMAVDYAIANWDGITTFYAGSWGKSNHNFYMYQSEDTGRFTLIPWDLNATFFLDHWLGNIQPWDVLDTDCKTVIPMEDSTDLGTLPASCDPTIRAIALSKERYHQSVQRLLDEVFVVETLYKKVDDYATQISIAMKDDPFVSLGEMTEGADYIKSMIPTLRSRLEAVLTEGAAP